MKSDPETGSRERILFLLKTKGATTAARLGRHLGITSMAVRQHLQRLSDGGLVGFEDERGSVGRPARIWSLTDAAAEQFPEGYADLALDMLGAMRETFGEDGLTQLLKVRSQAQAERYRATLPAPDQGLAKRVAALARLRRDEGYMAESAKARDGSVLLIENHCPICAAATVCAGLCGAELDLFREALGPDVKIEREEHILNGDRRCTYRFS
ncbi:MAG: putative ArsR family transcriptional regulator [Pseudohongiellaceae bacterium]|jgi:predicted ArsR family transcriptional regulator